MYIRQTKTSASASGDPYYTYRLVSSERIGSKVRQRTRLNLGGAFSIPREMWPKLCARMEEILSGQLSLRPEDEEIEQAVQRYAAQLLASQRNARQSEKETSGDFHEVDVDSLELIRPRSVGVEHIGLASLKWLELPGVLKAVGFNGVECAVAIGGIIARMAEPGSEMATWQWLRERSALGELIDFDYESISPMRLFEHPICLLNTGERSRMPFSPTSGIFSA